MTYQNHIEGMDESREEENVCVTSGWLRIDFHCFLKGPEKKEYFVYSHFYSNGLS